MCDWVCLWANFYGRLLCCIPTIVTPEHRCCCRRKIFSSAHVQMEPLDESDNLQETKQLLF